MQSRIGTTEFRVAYRNSYRKWREGLAIIKYSVNVGLMNECKIRVSEDKFLGVTEVTGIDWEGAKVTLVEQMTSAKTQWQKEKKKAGCRVSTDWLG